MARAKCPARFQCENMMVLPFLEPVWQEVEGGRFAACLPKIGQRMSGKDFLRLTATRLAQVFPGLKGTFFFRACHSPLSLVASKKKCFDTAVGTFA